MSPFKRNITRVVIFTTIVLFSAAISSGIYYLKIQKNEDTQNQLQFRELKDASNSIGMSLEKLKQISKYFKSSVPCDATMIDRTSDGEINWRSMCWTTVNERIKQINQSQDFRSIKIDGFAKGEAGQQEIVLNQNGLTYINTSIPLKINSLAGFESVDVRLNVETQDLIPSSIERFAVVMVANGNGDILARQDFVMDQATTQDLGFASLAPFVAENQSQGTFGNSISNMQDISVAGIEYRLYIQPLKGNELWSEEDRQILVGLVPMSTINVNKLLISPVVIMWAVLCLLLLVSFTPLLKLRFINNKYAFTSADISQVSLGLVLCAAILSIGANQQMFYQYFMDTKVEQSKLIHKTIRDDFTSEINALVEFAETQHYQQNLSDITSPNHRVTRSGFTNLVNPNMAFKTNDSGKLVNLNSKDGNSLFIVEQLAKMTESGTFVEDSDVHYMKSDLFINSKIDISEREYFKKAMACESWKFAAHNKQSGSCKQSVYIQRINNLEDGRKNSMLAMPLFDSVQDADKSILIFNTRLKSFMQRVLPMNFGFAVVNKHGDVLYHSNNEASLIENLFVETNRNQQLITAIQQHSDANSPIPLDVKYAGVNHLFVTAPLISHTSDKPLPWSLVVFYNETDIAMNNMILVFLAVFVLFAIIVPLFFLLRHLAHQGFWRQVLYFNEKKAKKYRLWAWYIASLSLACMLSIGLVNDLLLRLIVWLVACLLVVLFLHRANKVDLRAYYLLHYPQSSLVLFIIFFALLALASDLLDISVTGQNVITALVGILLAIFAYLLASNQLPRNIARKLKLPLASMPKAEGKVRHRQYADDERYTMGFVCYLASIVFLAGAIPAIMTVNSTHGYLLQRQAQMQSIAIEQAIDNRASEHSAYLQYLDINTPSLLSQRIAWHAHDDLKTLFPARLIVNPAPEPNSLGAWINVLDHSYTQPGISRDNFSDDLLDTVFASLSIQDSLGTQLSYLALSEQQQHNAAKIEAPNSFSQNGFSLFFRPDMYMLSATMQRWLNVLAGFVLLFTLLYGAIKYLVVRRLMGEHVPEHFRVVRPCDAYCIEENRWPLLRLLYQRLKAHTEGEQVLSQIVKQSSHILLLNANSPLLKDLCNKLDIKLYQDQIYHISDLLDMNAGIFTFEDTLRHTLSKDTSLQVVLAVNGLDEISSRHSERNLAVNALTKLCDVPRLHIILVADTAPGYRLLKHEAYAEDFSKSEGSAISIDEKLAWAKLLTRFEKEYAWSPKQKQNLRNPLNISKVIEYESKGWEELKAIREKFYDYHKRVKSQQGSIHDVQDFWVPDQVIEFFLVQASPLYRKHWELCTVDEKVALWQLAQGAHINPTNSEVIQHLTRRGFIYRDHGWHLMNESFRRFILSAESNSVIAHWMDTTRSGLWPIIRIPLFTLLFVLIVIVVYSSGFALNSVLGVATTTLGIIPLLLKNLSLIKGAGAGLGD